MCSRFRRNVENQIPFQIPILVDRGFILLLYHHRQTAFLHADFRMEILSLPDGQVLGVFAVQALTDRYESDSPDSVWQ